MLLCKTLVYDGNEYNIISKTDEFTDALISSSNLSEVHFKNITRQVPLAYFLLCLECNRKAKLRKLKIGVCSFDDTDVHEAVFTLSAMLVKKHVATLRTFCLVAHVESAVSVRRLARAITRSSIEKLVWDVSNDIGVWDVSDDIGVDSFTHRFLDECVELTSLFVPEESIDQKFCASLSQNSKLRVIKIMVKRDNYCPPYSLINWYALHRALSLNASVACLFFKRSYNGIDQLFYRFAKQITTDDLQLFQHLNTSYGLHTACFDHFLPKYCFNIAEKTHECIMDNAWRQKAKIHRLKKWQPIKSLGK
jgi:hypothetical protein